MRGMFATGVRAVIAMALATIAILSAAPAAEAAFGLTNLSATPADDAAGANTDLTIGLSVQDPAADLKDLTIHLPPGLVGNPQATVICTETQLAGDSCPAASDVGDVSNDVTATVLGFLPAQLTVSGNLYNVAPRPGEPARFGIVLNPTPLPIPGNPLLPKIILQSAAVLRQSDLGLDTVLNDLPNTATVAGLPTAIDIKSITLTLAGTVGSPPRGFIRLPTSCGAHAVGFDADSYPPVQTASGTSSFTTTNCAALPFTPELAAHVAQAGSTDAVELTTTISQTIDEAGLKRAQVILPKELFGNAGVLSTSCPDAAFQAGTCPANTIVGTAVAGSPLLAEPLSGPVALVSPAAAGLPDLGIDLRGPLALKLKGTIGITADVRNIVTFDGLPDIPIADFSLTFAGGPGGLTFANRDLCRPPQIVFDANFDSHSGATAGAHPAAVVTCSGSGGGGGGNGGGRKPRAKVAVRGRGSGEPRLALKIKAGAERLRTASIKLPRRLSFASGRRFDRGATVGGRVTAKHTRRALKLKARKPLAKLNAKFAHGAVKPGKGLRPGSKLEFAFKLRDASGKTTKLRVRAK